MALDLSHKGPQNAATGSGANQRETTKPVATAKQTAPASIGQRRRRQLRGLAEIGGTEAGAIASFD